jgi:hypothetical protein
MPTSIMFTIEQINDLHDRLGSARTFSEYLRALKAIGVERSEGSPRVRPLREIPRPAGESEGLRNDAAFMGDFKLSDYLTVLRVDFVLFLRSA